MKLYLDEDLSPAIADFLRQKHIDAISALEVGNVQLDDRGQLAYAAREGRAIVTANVVDFVELAHDAVATNTEHAGIVLVPSSFRGDEFRAIADAIFEALKPYPDNLRGHVLYISRR
ncbi:MAG: DUF5615 family PIN-like protein [Candidatus Rokubacteria bacterium]|nr:DUF5615 family PIN-like protein [Candidatus Rokubacteria bacterium]